jgi:hypothetical protein
MTTRFRLPRAAIPLLLLLSAASARAADILPDQTLLDLPAAAKEAIRKEAGGRTINGITREVADGKTVYKATIAQNGIDERLSVAADGTVLDKSDYKAVNDATANAKRTGSAAWEKTKEVSKSAWQATKDTVGKAVDSFKSDELTLNQVPEKPRATLEKEAGLDRLTDIRVKDVDGKHTYLATVVPSTGDKVHLTVAEDGSLVERK